MKKHLKRWGENHYWSYVEKYGVLEVDLDDPQTVIPKHCRYDVMLRIDDIVKDENINFRKFHGGKCAVFSIPHTEEAVSKFFRDLNNILDKTQLHMINHPIIERYKEGERINNFCDMLIPIEWLQFK